METTKTLTLNSQGTNGINTAKHISTATQNALAPELICLIALGGEANLVIFA